MTVMSLWVDRHLSKGILEKLHVLVRVETPQQPTEGMLEKESQTSEQNSKASKPQTLTEKNLLQMKKMTLTTVVIASDRLAQYMNQSHRELSHRVTDWSMSSPLCRSLFLHSPNVVGNNKRQLRVFHGDAEWLKFKI